MIFQAPTLHETIALANAFASCTRSCRLHVPILLHGQLGAGKTTFIRYLVESLPGSHNAEVSSPSFNILNIYPTKPTVGHFDLYRTAGLEFDADLEETLSNPQYLCLIEWAEYLPEDCLPPTYITMSWNISDQLRTIHCDPVGDDAVALLDCVKSHFSK